MSKHFSLTSGRRKGNAIFTCNIYIFINSVKEFPQIPPEKSKLIRMTYNNYNTHGSTFSYVTFAKIIYSKG